MQQKRVDARFFFFQVCFGDLAQLKLLPSEHCPKKSMVFPGSKCYAEKQKKEEHGMGFKALVGYCCLYPGQPPGASKLSRHFGGLFPITNELLSANKQQTKTQALVANDESLEAKEGVQYNGSHPTTSKVYTDLRGFTDISKIR